MKYFGDIPDDHLELVEELQRLETLFNKHSNDFSPLATAKGMVCIAHDYHYMGMDEEGDRFIRTAEEYCPGYFKAPIHIHMEKDENFHTLVTQLKSTIGLDLMESFGFEK